MYDSSYPVIFLVCDSKYISYLHCFLRFVEANVIDKQVFVHFINTDTKTIRNICELYPIVRDYSCEDIVLNEKNTNIALPPFGALRQSHSMYVSCQKKGFGKLYSDKVAYCANIRSKKIADILTHINTDLIYIDVDNIVNRDLKELYEFGSNADILCVPAYVDTDAISTTLFYIKNSDKTVSFFKKMSEIVEQQMYKWGIDHIAFNKLLHTTTLKKAMLPAGYYDETYDPKSVIWINHLTMYGLTDKYQEAINEIHFHPDTLL
tara:strand:- start:2079 stop:2867 length:789 start_codon:yes stop_codon:yes gene_type:complete